MSLVAVVSCVRNTHIGCISVFLDTLHAYEAITMLSPMPGQAALRAEVLCAFHFIVELSVVGQLGGVHCVPTAMPTSKKPSQRPRQPTMSSSPSTSSQSPLPKTTWTGPWHRRQTTRTTRPYQTRCLSRS